MVERIDRPEAPQPWKIKETGRTKDDRHSQQQEESKEQKKKKFEKRAEGDKWKKLGGRTMVIKPMRVPLKDIKALRYRNVTMHSGIVTLEASMEWKIGRVSDGVVVRLAGLDAYMKVKRLKIGDEVPRELWAISDPLEVGIPMESSSSGSFNTEEIEREAAAARQKETPKPRTSRSFLELIGLKSRITGKFQWAVFFLYIIIAMGIALGLHALFTMTRV
jgi:hypothetical protein